jgi:hypothetical protein
MADEQFQPAACCTTCPHFDAFERMCTHNLRQSIIKELTGETAVTCPIYPEVRAESMRDLEQELASDTGPGEQSFIPPNGHEDKRS